MNYLVLELQTIGDVTTHLAWSYNNINEAESKYHAVLSSAAISTISVHAASLLNQEGQVIKSWFYEHESEGTNE